LAVASAGFAVAGPMELFMPEGAAAYLGAWVWMPLLGLYTLCALLVALLMRPRIMIYNISAEQLHPVLEAVASRLDPERRWAGGSLLLPQLGLQLTVEAAPSMKHVQLVAGGLQHQDLTGWRRLEVALNEALQSVAVPPNRRGLSLIFLGLVIAVMVLMELSRQPAQVAQAWDQFLRR
jgi:hypothetical protein